MSGFHCVGVIGRPARVWAAGTLNALGEVLQRAEVRVLAVDNIASSLPGAESVSQDELIASIDLAVVVGGDGSLLSVAWPLARAGVPVTGINFGRLGFLADIAPDVVAEQLPLILAGKGVADERLLLSGKVSQGDTDSGADDHPRALNEILLHSPEPAHLGEFEVRADGAQLYRTRADGIIVATPTGSTAYSLSAGGPILAPGLSGLTVVPMLAHGAGLGSVVLPADSVIEVRTAKEAQLTVDGQPAWRLRPGSLLRLQSEPKTLCLLHPGRQNFYARVRDKLGWGLTAVAEASD